MRQRVIEIAGRKIGEGQPAFIVAEISANHNQSYEAAAEHIKAAKAAGADGVKIQTYTADTLTIPCDNEYFKIKEGPWAGRTLHELYQEAFTPWDWQPKLKKIADELGIILFSTPFDETAVDFLEEMNVPCHKIASFELVDLPLIKKAAETGKPLIMSTGMATLSEIEEAVAAARDAGCKELLLLKCNSAYPAPPEEMNLLTIAHLADAFDVPTGLSDHTLGIAVPIAAVTLGACMIEKHFTLSRARKGPDSFFSIEPAELKAMIEAVRIVEKAKGGVSYQASAHEISSRIFRRSLFVVKDIKKGEPFTKENVRSIRPGYGLPPKYLENIIGTKAVKNISQGTPLGWELIG
ncbi:MAG TPA: pseudaminic acid synthase [Candidatus Sumerlaeota bacterium]|nr:MAG: Pseudaminic acid synthase [candidate division BRC1 bacterium ADurb.Bin183]HOE62436.1 pseudaminic acid synthase [Candidatus Sumerlaeota bacterium]HRR30763.1 pseudaminic acid synthase [Candidatus Sumerlaeia bacterium]HON50123.1 pseudaminic acid synthase [Candidatus Sumerlaeota bacterium]HOR63339.1 pseudaminic acid synthase [Candidatus Sumerlaeota bacterium]